MAKKEIYARAAVQLRTHDRPREAEQRCPGAMGLYFFLLLQARGEQTFGDVSEAAAYESWSAPSTYRKKQAKALIAAGLVELRDGRLNVVKYADHNDTPEDIEAAKAATRKRVQAHRQANDVTRYMHVTDSVSNAPCNGDVPISSSISVSGSDLEGESRGGPPDWFEAAIETVAMTTGERISAAEAWLRYRGHRAKKREPMSPPDAEYWVTTVIVPELRRERQLARERSDARAERRDGHAQPGPPPMSREQSKAFARELVARVQAGRAKPTGTDP